MKKLLLLFSILVFTQNIEAQTVVLDTNGVTIKWTGTTVPSPYFVQANPRGTGMEWFAVVDDNTRNNITDYAKNIPSGITYFTPPGQSNPIPFNNIATTLVAYMGSLFNGATSFDQPIGSWDVSRVTFMNNMFLNANAFNQPIGSWNVNSVTSMLTMFHNASSFNQPIGSWNVGNVTDMNSMFKNATSFNQPIGSWNVNNVTLMSNMFNGASSFNQPIGSWNVSNVTYMGGVFASATSFNQTIGSWNVSNVNNMIAMFQGATAFNQPIDSWDVSNVTSMENMFRSATSFNQPIDSWDVSSVTTMLGMFQNAGLSIANYDALLIGWSTISPNETPLKPNVTFSGGNSKYCNGATARASIISTYGWGITDSGRDCSLDTEEFDINSLKLYPNPVLSVLNINVDSKLINQPYNVVDSLGRVVLNGSLDDVDTSINVEQLSKGIYYLKVSDKNASKFIKE